MSKDTTCMYSVIRNVSGGTKNFPWIPPHGRELAANAEVSIFGSILEAVNRGDRFGPEPMDSLEAAVERGDIEIRTLPKPILMDELLDDVKVISLVNDALVLEDPCWESLSAA